MSNREVMQQALEAMETNQYTVAELAPHRDVMKFNNAITALRKALEQPEQEPKHVVKSNGRHSPLLTHMMNKRDTTPPAAQPEQGAVAQSDLVERLRDTASKGVSVWGDLQLEAAREIEILTAERECYANAMDRMLAAQPEQEPVETYIHHYRSQSHPNDFGIPKGHWWQAKQYADAVNTTSPAAQRPWVGLTEGDRNDLEDYFKMTIGKAAFDAIEARLKERNT